MIGLMMKMSKVEVIEDYLDELFKEPKCELNYNNDYELLIAIVLSMLFGKYDSLEKLMNADIKDIEDILRPLGSFRKKALYVKEIARILFLDYDGKVPIKRKELEAMPGVGRKTVNVFLGEFYNIPTIAVDTHVERVSKRLGLAKDIDDVRGVEEKLKRKFKREDWAKRHLQLVLFGRYHCKAVSPNCDACKLNSICKYKKRS